MQEPLSRALQKLAPPSNPNSSQSHRQDYSNSQDVHSKSSSMNISEKLSSQVSLPRSRIPIIANSPNRLSLQKNKSNKIDEQSDKKEQLSGQAKSRRDLYKQKDDDSGGPMEPSMEGDMRVQTTGSIVENIKALKISARDRQGDFDSIENYNVIKWQKETYIPAQMEAKADDGTKFDVNKLSDNVKNIIKKSFAKSSYRIDQEEQEGDQDLINQVIQFEEPLEIEEADEGEREDKNKRKCVTIMQFSSKFRIRWDLCIIILAIYNALQIPFEIAFKPENNIGNTVSGYLIDLLFLCDIVFNFRTTFVNPQNGLEVFDGRKIAFKYLCHWRFTTDVISIIPFELFYDAALRHQQRENGGHPVNTSNSVAFKVFDLLKLIRLLRLGRIITYLKVKSNVKMAFRLVQLVFMFLMFSHWIACISFLVVQNVYWIPPEDQASGTTLFYQNPITSQYITCFYYAILNIASNEMDPVGPLQTVFCSLIAVIGQIISAFIFGNMAALMSNVNKKDSQFQQQFDKVVTLMKTISLPEPIQEEIEKYLITLQSRPDMQQDLEKFFMFVSPSLKRQILFHLYRNIIKTIPVLKTLDNLEIRFIVSSMKSEIFMPDDIVIRQNDKGNRLYFVSTGKLEVYIQNDSNEEEGPRSHRNSGKNMSKFQGNEYSNYPQRLVRVIYEGDYFGEIALFTHLKRTATIRAADFSTLGYLNKKNFRMTQKDFPQVYESLKAQIIERYNDENFRFRRKMIRNVPYFKYLSEPVIQQMLYLLRQKRYEKDSLIVKRGQSSDCIFFLKSGTIHVEQPLKNDEFMHVDSLNQGSCFSIYDAFHEDMKQKYDYRCKTTCLIEVIRANDIKKLEKIYAELADVLQILRMQLEGSSKMGSRRGIGESNNLFGSMTIAMDKKLAETEKGSYAKSNSVDFDYFRYTSYSKDTTIEKEVASSYVRKRFRLAISKFFHKLKRSFISNAVGDKEELKGKFGIQILNFLKQKAEKQDSHPEQNDNYQDTEEPKPKTLRDNLFQIKLNDIPIKEQEEMKQMDRLDLVKDLSRKSGYSQQIEHTAVFGNQISGPMLSSGNMLELQGGDKESVMSNEPAQQNNQTLQERVKSVIQQHQIENGNNFYQNLIKRAKTLKSQQEVNPVQSIISKLNPRMAQSSIDMESLIQFSLSKQKPSQNNDQFTSTIQKALAKIDKDTDKNLISALNHINSTVVKQQDKMLQLQLNMSKRLKRMHKKLDDAMVMGTDKELKGRRQKRMEEEKKRFHSLVNQRKIGKNQKREGNETERAGSFVRNSLQQYDIKKMSVSGSQGGQGQKNEVIRRQQNGRSESKMVNQRQYSIQDELEKVGKGQTQSQEKKSLQNINSAYKNSSNNGIIVFPKLISSEAQNTINNSPTFNKNYLQHQNSQLSQEEILIKENYQTSFKDTPSPNQIPSQKQQLLMSPMNLLDDPELIQKDHSNQQLNSDRIYQKSDNIIISKIQPYPEEFHQSTEPNDNKVGPEFYGNKMKQRNFYANIANLNENGGASREQTELEWQGEVLHSQHEQNDDEAKHAKKKSSTQMFQKQNKRDTEQLPAQVRNYKQINLRPMNSASGNKDTIQIKEGGTDRDTRDKIKVSAFEAEQNKKDKSKLKIFSKSSDQIKQEATSSQNQSPQTNRNNTFQYLNQPNLQNRQQSQDPGANISQSSQQQHNQINLNHSNFQQRTQSSNQNINYPNMQAFTGPSQSNVIIQNSSFNFYNNVPQSEEEMKQMNQQFINTIYQQQLQIILQNQNAFIGLSGIVETNNAAQQQQQQQQNQNYQDKKQ